MDRPVQHCDDECRECYPYYGVSPHECYWRKPGGFKKNPLGTSTIQPFENWPENFLVEVEGVEDINDILSWGSCGIYLCPRCLNGGVEKHTSEHLLSNEQAAKLLGNSQ